jgi:hypothetical protein
LETAVRKVHPQVWVALGSTIIIAGSAYPVFSKNTRAGHDLFSSDKPEAIRESQEAKRREYRERIKEQREKLRQEQEAVTVRSAQGGGEGQR